MTGRVAQPCVVAVSLLVSREGPLNPLGNRRALYPLISLPVNSGASWLKASSGGQVGVASLLS